MARRAFSSYSRPFSRAHRTPAPSPSPLPSSTHLQLRSNGAASSSTYAGCSERASGYATGLQAASLRCLPSPTCSIEIERRKAATQVLTLTVAAVPIRTGLCVPCTLRSSRRCTRRSSRRAICVSPIDHTACMRALGACAARGRRLWRDLIMGRKTVIERTAGWPTEGCEGCQGMVMFSWYR